MLWKKTIYFLTEAGMCSMEAGTFPTKAKQLFAMDAGMVLQKQACLIEAVSSLWMHAHSME